MAPKREIRSIAELPFEQLPAAQLFDVHEDRGWHGPKGYSYYGFGWTLVRELELQSGEGPQLSRRVRDALVVLVHAYDEQPEQPDPPELDLGFWLDDDKYYEEDSHEDDSLVIVTPLSAFVRVHLPRALAACARPPSCVVLCVCNEGRIDWQLPDGLSCPPLWFPSGETRGRCTLDPTHPQGFRLHFRALHWRLID